jgi:hypothetical protein
MAYAFIAEADNFATTTASTITLAQTYTGGESVVVCFNHNNSPTSNAVTITDGTNTYTPVNNAIDTGLGVKSWIFFCPSAVAGSYTLTGTVNANTNWRAIAAYRYSGLANSAAEVTASQRQVAPGTGTDAVSSTSMTPTAAPAMVFGFTVNVTDTSAPAAGTGFTDQGRPASWTAGSMGAARMEDKRVTNAAAVSSTFTSSVGTETYITVGAVFGEAGTGTTPALVQTTSGTNSGTNTSMSCTLSGVTAGNLLVLTMSAQSSGAGAPDAPLDTNGTPQLAIQTGPWGSGTGIYTGIYHIANAASGTHTVSVANIQTSARPSYITLTEFSNMANFAPYDVSASAGHSDSTQSLTVTTGSTGQSQEIIIAALAVSSSVGSAGAAITDPPAGYTSLYVNQNDTATTNLGAEVSYKLVAGTGAQSATWTWTDANTRGSAGVIATYRSNAAVATWVFYRPAIQFVDESVIQH